MATAFRPNIIINSPIIISGSMPIPWLVAKNSGSHVKSRVEIIGQTIGPIIVVTIAVMAPVRAIQTTMMATIIAPGHSRHSKIARHVKTGTIAKVAIIPAILQRMIRPKRKNRFAAVVHARLKM